MIHIVWIGDESKRPDDCIDTWRKFHEVRVWGNDDLKNRSWFNAKHMMEFTRRELCGVADMMRYEILYEEGGIAVDADSICERKLEDWMFETPIAAWENEIAPSPDSEAAERARLRREKERERTEEYLAQIRESEKNSSTLTCKHGKTIALCLPCSKEINA